jgi:hypothetical protein
MKLSASAFVAILIGLLTVTVVAYAVMLKRRNDKQVVTPSATQPAAEALTARPRRGDRCEEMIEFRYILQGNY